MDLLGVSSQLQPRVFRSQDQMKGYHLEALRASCYCERDTLDKALIFRIKEFGVLGLRGFGFRFIRFLGLTGESVWNPSKPHNGLRFGYGHMTTIPLDSQAFVGSRSFLQREGVGLLAPVHHLDPQLMSFYSILGLPCLEFGLREVA